MNRYLSKYFKLNAFFFPNRVIGLLLIGLFAVLISCKDESESVKKSTATNPTPTNPIGTPPITECARHVLYGYCDKVSYNRDEKITVYIQSDLSISTCRLDIFDLNQNLIFSAPSNSLFEQKISTDPAVNGYGFVSNATIEIPASIKSGAYLINGRIPFIVKEKSAVDLLVVYPSNTANAYCMSGGKSLYSIEDRPFKVSFERPINIQEESVPCMSWFSSLPGLQVGYAADVDLDDYSLMSSTKILVIIGHNEYWSRKARRNFDKFVHEGGNAIILSGNTMWWQIRYTDDKKTLICHKAITDPMLDPLQKTLVWVDPSLQYSIVSSIGCDFDRGGYGIRYADEGWDGYKIALPESPLLKGVNLNKGDILNLPSVEYDGAPIKEFVNGYPILDKEEMGMYKAELIGFDYGLRNSKKTVGTFIVIQPKENSGVIVNAGSMNWCDGIGGSEKNKFRKITLNAINGMLNDKSLFVK